ncbi:MAG TPA: hypothetical protein VH796_06845 [Nitrososphaeraceae archaeon]
MDYLGKNHILVLEKGTGAIRLISVGILQKRPFLKVLVNSTGERWLLGIAHKQK